MKACQDTKSLHWASSNAGKGQEELSQEEWLLYSTVHHTTLKNLALKKLRLQTHRSLSQFSLNQNSCKITLHFFPYMRSSQFLCTSVLHVSLSNHFSRFSPPKKQKNFILCMQQTPLSLYAAFNSAFALEMYRVLLLVCKGNMNEGLC